MLISFEGLPGSGKTTQARMLADRLASEGVPVTYLPDLATMSTSELGASLIGLFASSGDPFMRHGDVLTDTYLAAAIRADVAATLIEPALRLQHVVIEDRGVHTMCSYSLASILRDHQWDTSAAVRWLGSIGRLAGRGPDIAIRLQLPIAQCAARTARRGTRVWNAEQASFLGYVDQAYRELEARAPGIIPVSAARLSEADVHALVSAALAGRLQIPAPGSAIRPQTAAPRPRLGDRQR